MDVPAKWGLEDFLKLASAVAKQHRVDRRTVPGIHRASCYFFWGCNESMQESSSHCRQLEASLQDAAGHCALRVSTRGYRSSTAFACNACVEVFSRFLGSRLGCTCGDACVAARALLCASAKKHDACLHEDVLELTYLLLDIAALHAQEVIGCFRRGIFHQASGQRALEDEPPEHLARYDTPPAGGSADKGVALR